MQFAHGESFDLPVFYSEKLPADEQELLDTKVGLSLRWGKALSAKGLFYAKLR